MERHYLLVGMCATTNLTVVWMEVLYPTSLKARNPPKKAKEKNSACVYSLYLQYVIFESHCQIPQIFLLKIGYDYAVCLPHVIIIKF